MKKIFSTVIVLLGIIFICSNVFAVSDPGYDPSLVPGQISDKTGEVWATVVVIVQIISVACVVFTGLRYMFASADQKADIKQGLMYLGIGAALVFGATVIIQVVANAANDML